MAYIANGCLVLVLCVGILIPCLCSHNVVYHGNSKISEGDSFEISCVMPIQDPSEWTVNGSLVIKEDNDMGYSLTQAQVDTFHRRMILKVQSAQLFQAGEYRCNRYSRDFVFVRITPYSWEDHESDIDKAEDNKEYGVDEFLLEIGNTYEFNCRTKDKKMPIMWSKNDKIINYNSEEGSGNLEVSGTRLMIRDAQEEDSGEYSCIPGKFPLAESSPPVRFRLNSPAKIIDFPQNVGAIRGRALYIQCKARGYPQPRITWFIDNLNASHLKEKDPRISIFSKAEKKSTSNVHLVVRNMSEHDRGFYTCRAENSIDGKYDEKTVYIHIRDNMITTNEDEPGLGKVLIPGKPLLLHCNTTECPQCVLVWYKDGEPLDSISNHLEIIEGNNSVSIQNPTYNDTGLYVCAVNRAQINMDISAAIRVQSCSDFFYQGYLSSTLSQVCEIYNEDTSSGQECWIRITPLLHAIIAFFLASVFI